MKQQPERMPENARGGTVPLIMVEGKRMLRRTARRAGETAGRVSRRTRRLVGETVQRTEKLTRRNPWASIGTAVGAGFLLGGLCTFLFYRGR
jgi:ElaB/YqjD/DUF883 family membrane-anchored ribosome-binding protein